MRLNLGNKLITFEDENGEVFSTFNIRTSDTGILDRTRKIVEFFEHFNPPDGVDGNAQANKEIAEKFNYILGYNEDRIFENLAPTSAVELEDGSVRLFAELVLDKIVESFDAIATRMTERAAAIDAAVAAADE